jgi:hypothetical protein
VKIGWTASAVKNRLKGWSKCGYEPNLLFSLSDVPHAQRVETLTHHELIKEWRRERKCKASWCGTSHREWFEINEGKAKQVLSAWAKFIGEVKPYDSNGHLKAQWKTSIAKIDRQMAAITAEQLLDYYEATLIDEPKVLREQVDMLRASKNVEASTEHYTKVMQPKASIRGYLRVNSLETVHLSSPKGTALGESKASHNIPKADPSNKSKPSWSIRSTNGEVSAPSVALVKKELTPEDIPLPPSPILVSATLGAD